MRHLGTLTPRIWVTYALLFANVAVYAAMVLSGADWMEPRVDALLRFGADYGPRTTGGEWWRLLSNTFVHIGLIHLAFNMVVLAQIGVLVERLVGSLPFLVVYLLSGILGSFASIAWNAGGISAGASGAVFGCYGLFLAVLARNRGVIPPAVHGKLLRGAGLFIVYNLGYAALQSNIDQLAHLGGLAAGFILGLIVALPLAPGAVPLRTRRAVVALAAGLALCAGLAAVLPRAGDWMAELVELDAAEARGVARAQEVLAQGRAGKLDDKSAAAVIRQEILPPLVAARERLAHLARLRGRPRKVVDISVRYADKRAEAWTTMADALETSDAAKQAQIAPLFKAANVIMKELSDMK